MICPKCESMEMRPDPDRIRGIEAYYCWKCGNRIYPLYPRRVPSEDDAERSPNICQMHNTGKTRRESGNKHRALVAGICKRCGDPFEGGPNRKYCADCIDIAKREYNEVYYKNRRIAA